MCQGHKAALHSRAEVLAKDGSANSLPEVLGGCSGRRQRAVPRFGRRPMGSYPREFPLQSGCGSPTSLCTCMSLTFLKRVAKASSGAMGPSRAEAPSGSLHQNGAGTFGDILGTV